MIIDNPYLTRIRHLVVEIDRQKTARNLDKVMELETELTQLKAKERVLWDERIAEVTENIEKVKDDMKRIPQHKTKTQQIQEIIRLKRLVQGQYKDGKLIKTGLIHELRELGKEIRK